MSHKLLLILTLLAASSLPAADRPNILLILADDLGYSDIGCYGGEIKTPNLDRLAAGGLRFTQFYNCARCCPTRAALQSGLYPHQAGVGNMTGDGGLPGYRGHLTDNALTLGEALKSSGYLTYMCGKWHLGKPNPIDRGYGEYYGLLGGFDSFWNPKVYSRLPNDRPLRIYQEGKFYATDALTDYGLEFLQTHRGSAGGKPFFLFMAYNAPHFPLHAPKELIDQYVPIYQKGWDEIRRARHERMRKLGIVRNDWALTPRSTYHGFQDKGPHGTNPAWDSLPADRRADLARRMAIFAAMVDRMDQNIGRLIEDLQKHNQLDNTLILFLSDNGACSEWDPFGFDTVSGPGNLLHTGDALAQMGLLDSYLSYGSGWANAGNTPWRLYKHYIHEGGISTPLIAHWPKQIKTPGAWRWQVGHVIDLMPTFLDAAGDKYPAEYVGRKLSPLEGISILPAISDQPLARPAPLFWEHEGNKAVRDGQWKLVAVHDQPWELYDIENDRVEMKNLADQFPERVQALAAQWEQWAHRAQVLPKPTPQNNPVKKKGKKK